MRSVFPQGTGDQPPFQMRCRGQICELTIDESSAEASEWMERLQFQAGVSAVGMFGAVALGPISYFELEEPARAAGTQWLFNLKRSFDGSPGKYECKKQSRMNSVVTLTLAIEPRSRRVQVSSSGSPMGDGTDTCLKQALERVVALFPLPEVVDLPVSSIEVRVP